MVIYGVAAPVKTPLWARCGRTDIAPVIATVERPLGGGVGKIFRIYGQLMNASLQAFDFVATPSGGPAGNYVFSCNSCFRNEVETSGDSAR